MSVLRKMVSWILGEITATGQGFSLTGMFVVLRGIRQRPWLVMPIGVGLLVAANIITNQTLHKCMQRENHLIDETQKCQICDYNLISTKILNS